MKATRREAMIGALTGAMLLARGAEATADTPAPSDPALLSELIAVEALLGAVYARVIATGLLSARVTRTAHRVIAQDRVHARVLGRQLRAHGGTPPAPLSETTATLDAALSKLKVSGTIDGLHSEHDCVRLLLDLATAAEGAYYKSISQFRDPALAQLAAQILASEAQHQTAISEARRPGDAWQAAPASFVKGKS